MSGLSIGCLCMMTNLIAPFFIFKSQGFSLVTKITIVYSNWKLYTRNSLANQNKKEAARLGQ